MAIAYDSSSTGATTGSSITFAHTCSGSDRVLIVAGEDNGSNNWTVTYPKGGSATALTQIDSDAASGLKMYYMIAPDTGTNNIVASKTGTFIVACAASYTGVKQTGFPDAQAKETYPADNGANEIISVTPTVNNCWVVGTAFVNANAATTSGGAPNTIRQSNSNASGGVGLGDNNSAINPATSTSLNFQSSSAGRAAIIISMAPSTVTTNSSFLMFM